MSPSATTLRIQCLVDIPAALPELAEWFRAEWSPFYGPSGPGNAEADLEESMHRKKLPICLVATDGAGRLAGTISLKATSISHGHLTPWAAALLVASDRRNQGIGTALVAALEDKARELSFCKVYISTDSASTIVERRGWRAIANAESLRGLVTVYEAEL